MRGGQGESFLHTWHIRAAERLVMASNGMMCGIIPKQVRAVVIVKSPLFVTHPARARRGDGARCDVAGSCQQRQQQFLERRALSAPPTRSLTSSLIAPRSPPAGRARGFGLADHDVHKRHVLAARSGRRSGGSYHVVRPASIRRLERRNEPRAKTRNAFVVLPRPERRRVEVPDQRSGRARVHPVLVVRRV